MLYLVHSLHVRMVLKAYVVSQNLIQHYCFSVTRTLTGHKSSIKCTDFHPYGEYITSGSMDTNVKVIYNYTTQIKLFLFTY